MAVFNQMPQFVNSMEDKNVTFWVSGGNHTKPFYRFYTDSQGNNEITNVSIDTNNSYTFRRLNSASSHPFYISDSGHNQNHTDAISITGSGSANKGITGSQEFTLSFKKPNKIDTLSYYCTSHANMKANFQIIQPSSVFTNAEVSTYDPLLMNLSDLFQTSGSQEISDQKAIIKVPGWQAEICINKVVNSNDSSLNARQLKFGSEALPSSQDVKVETSLLNGGESSQAFYGLAGWDAIDAGGGNDKIRGGNGRDILTGGKGSDEIWGDFGWNTYLGNDDGFKDLIVVKSDQLLENWWYGKSANNPNGEKADIITELDSIDQIKILGAASEDITISSASAHGLSGLGIYASGFLEALYTGKNITADQLSTMISGDASTAVMNNSQGFYGT